LNKAKDIDPKNPFIYDNLGDAYRLKGMFDEAAQHYHEALKLDSDFFISYYKLGRLYSKREPEKARIYFSKFLKYAKTDSLRKEVEEMIKLLKKGDS
jgi:tetratricopeptide (TPR) repeat protein